MKSVLTYFTGGINYSVPPELSLSYILLQLRFLFFSYLITYYFVVPYTVLTMVITVLLADFRFYLEFNEYIESMVDALTSDDSEDSDEDF